MEPDKDLVVWAMIYANIVGFQTHPRNEAVEIDFDKLADIADEAFIRYYRRKMNWVLSSQREPPSRAV